MCVSGRKLSSRGSSAAGRSVINTAQCSACSFCNCASILLTALTRVSTQCFNRLAAYCGHFGQKLSCCVLDYTNSCGSTCGGLRGGVFIAPAERHCKLWLIWPERFCQATFSAIYWNCWFTWRAHAPEQADGTGKSSLSSVSYKCV